MRYEQKEAIAALLLKCIADIRAIDSTVDAHMACGSVVIGFDNELQEHVLVSKLAMNGVSVDEEFAENVRQELDKNNVAYVTWA